MQSTAFSYELHCISYSAAWRLYRVSEENCTNMQHIYKTSLGMQTIAYDVWHFMGWAESEYNTFAQNGPKDVFGNLFEFNCMLIPNGSPISSCDEPATHTQYTFNTNEEWMLVNYVVIEAVRWISNAIKIILSWIYTHRDTTHRMIVHSIALHSNAVIRGTLRKVECERWTHIDSLSS